MAFEHEAKNAVVEIIVVAIAVAVGMILAGYLSSLIGKVAPMAIP